MKKFVIKEYTFFSEIISKTEESPKFIMISDLHNVSYGEQNKRLWHEIDRIRPDGILIAGDLLIGKLGEPMDVAISFLQTASARYPVYYSMGNHEHRIQAHPERYDTMYSLYERELASFGIKMMENESKTVTIRRSRITIHGLKIEESYYAGTCAPQLPVSDIKAALGNPVQDSFNILLAHNPKYTDAYFKWGAQLTLCGHYHGGIMRLPFINGFVDPSLTIFPKYCYGVYKREDRRVLVGPGLGEHTIPIRINNPRELIVLHVKHGITPFIPM